MSWKPLVSATLVAAALGCTIAPVPLAPSEGVRARLMRIEDTRSDEPAALDSALRSRNAVDRAAAALTVGRIGARAHLALLRQLIADTDTAVASNALFSLGLLKDSASAATAAAVLPAGGPKSVEAAWLLGEIGGAGRQYIVAALATRETPAVATSALLLAATRLKPVPAEVVTPLLNSPDSAIAWRAAYAIARGRSAEGLRLLLAQTRSPWPAVREQVARGAARSLAGDSLASLATSSLHVLVGDADAHVRVNAVRSVASFGASEAERVRALLADPDANVRVAAAQSLEQVLGTDAAPWSSAIDADTSFVVQQAVAAGAGRRGVRLRQVESWRSSTDAPRRIAASELDARGPAAQALASVSTYLNDSDGRVRAAAAGELARLADSAGVSAEARARLRAVLRDPDFAVRAAALGGLRRTASADDLALALDAYALSLADGDNDARLAFWRVADTVLKARTPLPDSVSRRLDQLARPADPLERLAASRIARFQSWRDSTGTPRPMAWYEDRVRDLQGRAPVLRIETVRGSFDLALFAKDAPLTVFNIVSLAKRGYFDGQVFHRVVPNFVVQGGDPRGDGNGGPGYAIRDEINRRRYLRGTLGMALSGPNTGGSQFFVTHSPQPHLDGGYTVFGQLTAGSDVLDRIVQGDRIVRITVR